MSGVPSELVRWAGVPIGTLLFALRANVVLLGPRPAPLAGVVKGTAFSRAVPRHQRRWLQPPPFLFVISQRWGPRPACWLGWSTKGSGEIRFSTKSSSLVILSYAKDLLFL